MSTLMLGRGLKKILTEATSMVKSLFRYSAVFYFLLSKEKQKKLKQSCRKIVESKLI